MHGYPPQGYPPGYGHYPQPRRGGKGKLIAIIVVVAALAAGGIVLAVVLSKKGSGGGSFSGAESNEELGKIFIDTLATGDGDKLVSLSPSYEKMLQYGECPPEKQEENKKSYTEQLDHSREAAVRFKGHALVYKGIEPLGERTNYAPGDALGDCKATKVIAMQNFMAVFEYDAVDKTKKTFKTNMFTVILDGKVFLLPGHVAKPDDLGDGGEPTTPTPPETPTPPPAGDLASITTEMEAIKSASCACTDKACADTQWTRLMTFVETNKPTLEAPGAESVNAMGSESIRCLDKLRLEAVAPPPEPTPPTPPPEPTPAGDAKGLPECDAYAKAAEKFINCSKAAKESRQAVANAVEQMKKNWGNAAALSEDSRKAAAQTCATLEDSMKKAAAAMGCK